MGSGVRISRSLPENKMLYVEKAELINVITLHTRNSVSRYPVRLPAAANESYRIFSKKVYGIKMQAATNRTSRTPPAAVSFPNLDAPSASFIPLSPSL